MSELASHDLRQTLSALQEHHQRDVAALRGELAALRQQRPRRRLRGRHPQRLFAVLATALLAALVPFSILAAGPTFSDLSTAAPAHQPNIQAIGDAGITTGFADPNNPNARLYDPKANVTREEMASFLARTAGLGTNPPVTNAAQLDGRGAGALIRASGGDVTSVEVGGTYANVGTATIFVPEAGYVIAVGTANLNVTSNSGACPCVALLRINHQTANAYSFNYNLRSAAGEGDAASATKIFPVTPGQHTFVLEMQKQSGTSTLTGTGALSLIYSPFGPSGNAP